MLLNSVIGILALAALIISILSGLGKAPLWVATILLSIIAILSVIPLR